MVEIIIRQPGAPDSSAKLAPGAYLFGSGRDCHIRLRRPEISGRHAQFIVRDREVTVMDLGSSNGTSIEGGPTLFALCPDDGARRAVRNALLDAYAPESLLLFDGKGVI